jgi:serine protease Do
MRACVGLLLAALAVALPAQPAHAQRVSADELVASVVRIKTVMNPDARTTKNLGREREGSGIVIDENGLVLTIGYLMVEAHSAEVTTNDGRAIPANVVGYDHETGFGLLQAIAPLKVKPMAFGRSSALAKDELVIAATGGGASRAAAVRVASKREFAGSWEYLLDEAIFTSPPIANWSGGALISREGKLVGVGSLIVGDAVGDGSGEAGNMFVPIDLLEPILADLIAEGRALRDPRPWIGMSTNEVAGRLVVSQVSPQSPAEKAGLRRGDIITGVDGAPAKSLSELWRKVWARGNAGASVPLEFEREGNSRKADLTSMNRLDHLKLKSTY